jgi:DnaK suppressor protein
MTMKTTPQVGVNGFRAILERNQLELIQALRKRDGIVIERSPDQIDAIQEASERDLAIRNAERESTLLLELSAALLRIHKGSFGICVECEQVISPKRLAAVPWASRCIQCQDGADQNGEEKWHS